VLTYEETWCDGHTQEERVPLKKGLCNPGEYITGITDLTAVDDAVEAAQGYLAGMGYREPSDQ